LHMCGDGPALAVLRQIVQENSLTESVIIHGHLQRTELLSIYTNSHAVIVPTKSTFTEGMPAVCAEAVLSGLPVVTSPVSNAFDVIGPAVVRAETDNIESYVSAILSLVNDRRLYAELRAQCPSLSKQFLDPSQGYSAAVNRLIMRLFPKQA
jgi:glycosyltransferase involved in cell wall biosynthesis